MTATTHSEIGTALAPREFVTRRSDGQRAEVDPVDAGRDVVHPADAAGEQLVGVLGPAGDRDQDLSLDALVRRHRAWLRR